MDKIVDKKGIEIDLDTLLHPGEVLADELASREVTKSSFALNLGMYPSHISEIINGKRNITARIAIKLEEHLGVDARFWMGLQMDYDLMIERNKLRNSA